VFFLSLQPQKRKVIIGKISEIKRTEFQFIEYFDFKKKGFAEATSIGKLLEGKK
jgi:hypothetical protein